MKLLVSLTCLAMALNAQAQTPADVAKDSMPAASSRVPIMQFPTNVLDLGRIVGGTVARATFTFTNGGKQTLEIKEVRPSCGCTTAGEWTHSVAPGAAGVIPFEFTPPNMDGPITKTIRVVSNDPTQPELSLELTATVWKAVDVMPPVLIFSFVGRAPTNPPKTVRITSKLAQPLQLSSPECADTNLLSELKTLEAGKMYELSVRPFSTPPGGNVSVPVKLKTSCAEIPIVTVTVMAVVVPLVEARPRSVVLPAPTMRSRPARVTVTVLNHLDEPLKLSDPQVDIPGIEVSLVEVQPGQVFKVGLACPPGLKIAAGQRGQVTIKTSDPDHPELVIPILPPPNPAALTSRRSGAPADPHQPPVTTLSDLEQTRASQHAAASGDSVAGVTASLGQSAPSSSTAERTDAETPARRAVR